MTLHVEVVSPERILWTGEAQLVLALTIGGVDIAFLTGHAPFVGALDIHTVRIHLESDEEVVVAAHGGFVEVSANRVTILSDVAELSEEDRITVARARKIQRFLSQPMFVAKNFTGLDGVFTPVEETVDSFEQLVNGDLDDLPEQAFLNVGGADSVHAKAAELLK